MARIRTSEKRLAVRQNPHARCFERWSRERDTLVDRGRRHAPTYRTVPAQAIQAEFVTSSAAGAAADFDPPSAEPTRNLYIKSHFHAPSSANLAAQSVPSAEPTRNLLITRHFRATGSGAIVAASFTPSAEPTRNFVITRHFQAPGFGAIVASQSAASAEPTRNFLITHHFLRLTTVAVGSPANRPQPSSHPVPACRSTCRSPTSGIHYFICDTIPLRRMPRLIPGVQSSTLERAK